MILKTKLLSVIEFLDFENDNQDFVSIGEFIVRYVRLIQ